jgi:predicted alpha/beta-hydrolase family hydrolase
MITGVDGSVTTPAGDVPIEIDEGRSGAVLVLGHGAGAGMDHPFMQEAATRIASLGPSVVRFNFAYIQKGKKAPDRQPVLEETYEAVVEEVRSALTPSHLFLGGKSMGGRIASYLPGRGIDCSGLVFLGYPLHPPGRPDRIRDAHLYDLSVPVLFVEGTRDPFCPLDLLDKVRAKMRADASVQVINGGDHSFKVPKSSGRSSAEAFDELVEGVVQWIEERS